MKLQDVMVFCPVYRLEPETVKGIFALEWEGALSVVFQRDNPSGDPYADHLHQYQRGRELFLAGKWEAMLVIESDILPPNDTLARLGRLLEKGADLAYGCYVFRPRGGNGQRVVNVLEKYYAGIPGKQARNMGESLTVRGLYQAARKLGVIECSGAGLGCVLIRREVLERVPFEAPKDQGFCDWEWTAKVYREGFVMLADLAIQCGHKDTTGEVLWAL